MIDSIEGGGQVILLTAILTHLLINPFTYLPTYFSLESTFLVPAYRGCPGIEAVKRTGAVGL